MHNRVQRLFVFAKVECDCERGRVYLACVRWSTTPEKPNWLMSTSRVRLRIWCLRVGVCVLHVGKSCLRMLGRVDFAERCSPECAMSYVL